VFDDGRTLLIGTSGVWTLAGLNKNVIDLPAAGAMTFPDVKGPEKVSEGPVLPPAPRFPRPAAPSIGRAGSANTPIAGDIAESALASGPIPGELPRIFTNATTLATRLATRRSSGNGLRPVLRCRRVDLQCERGQTATFNTAAVDRLVDPPAS
jgi:hypothetical protein